MELFMDNRGGLVLSQNLGKKTQWVLTSYNWLTVKVSATTLLNDRFDFPTTITKKAGKIYVLNAKLNKLNDPTAPPDTEFSLQLVRWLRSIDFSLIQKKRFALIEANRFYL